MRIVYLAAANSIHTIRWVNELSNRGHDVHLISLPNHTGDIDKISSNVKCYGLKFGGNIGYYLNVIQVKSIINKIDPDIINAHYASGYGTLARIAKCTPLVLSVWGSDVYDFPYQSSIKKKIVQKNLEYATTIASTSECMAAQVNSLLSENIRNIKITPFGVDTSLYKEKLINNNEIIKIGVIKSLSKRYRISDIIYAMEIIHDKYGSKVVLEIYGDGSERENLENLSKKLKLDTVVRFNGKVPNELVPDILNKLDIFVVSSNHESFGVAVVEAMAAQIPVVASDVDGFREVLGTSNAGFLIDVGNFEAMAKKISILIEDSELRARMGEKGYNNVRANYEWEKNVDTMENIYNLVSERK